MLQWALPLECFSLISTWVKSRYMSFQVPAPHEYCRYVDDNFVGIQTEKELQQFQNSFENDLVLNFTCEKCQDGNLPFPDIEVIQRNHGLETKAYTNPTDLGMCLNGISKCPPKI